MKIMYVCEHCGAQYESYEDCYQCESKHVDACSDFSTQLRKFATWNTGESMPRTIALASERDWRDTDDSKREFALYKFVRSLTAEEIESVKKEKEAADEDIRQMMERYRQDCNTEQAGA